MLVKAHYALAMQCAPLRSGALTNMKISQGHFGVMDLFLPNAYGKWKIVQRETDNARIHQNHMKTRWMDIGQSQNCTDLVSALRQ